MKIAVTYENGQVFQHFGHTAQFKLYQVEDGQVLSSQVVDTNGSGHGALAGFLQAQGVDTPPVRRHWRRRQNGPGPGGHPAVRRRHRQRGPGCGGFAGGQAGLFAGRAVHPPRGGPRRRATPAGSTAAGDTPAATTEHKKGRAKRSSLFAYFSFPKGSRGETSPTQEMSSWCMARVQATYSRFLSKSVW